MEDMAHLQYGCLHAPESNMGPHGTGTTVVHATYLGFLAPVYKGMKKDVASGKKLPIIAYERECRLTFHPEWLDAMRGSGARGYGLFQAASMDVRGSGLAIEVQDSIPYHAHQQRRIDEGLAHGCNGADT